MKNLARSLFGSGDKEISFSKKDEDFLQDKFKKFSDSPAFQFRNVKFFRRRFSSLKSHHFFKKVWYTKRR